MVEGGYWCDCLFCGVYYFLCMDFCVIMLIIFGDKVLFGCLLCLFEGIYIILVGFMEFGEIIEQVVCCEMFEEFSIQVGDV